MSEFDHERLDVYRLALEFVVVASDVAERMPKGRAYLADQLQRAATSIVLNIAEGAGEFPGSVASSAPRRNGHSLRSRP